MAQLGSNTQGEERPGLRAASNLRHVPALSEATWVGDWHWFERSCGHQYLIRHFGGRSLTVEMSFCDPVSVDIAGSQFSDGSIKMFICLDGDIPLLNADEALMLAATLSRAAEELDRIQGGAQ
jgi:hypothetical protein